MGGSAESRSPARKKAVRKRAERSSDEARAPVVGIGASAGGLEALTQLLEALPADTGMAFVLAPHLSHTHKSMLVELLGRVTPMPVSEVGRRTKIAGNHVYVIPASSLLTVHDGFLIAKPIPQGAHPVMVIDLFLRSLAEDRKNKAIGVILSGTGTDGTLGLAEIKAQGGVTFVQDEVSAKYPAMPRSASAEPGVADFTLPPAEIARRLVQIARHPYVNGSPAAAADPPDPQDQIDRIFRLVRAAGGVDYSHYKPTTIRRRIQRRMMLREIESLDAYVALLRQDREEVEALKKDLLIHVTGFFRDPKAFEALAALVVPAVFEAHEDGEPIRVWVAGCSSGEEAYSVVICLLEAAAERDVRIPIQVFASDVDKDAIDTARAGAYPHGIEADVSAERLRKFFTKTPGGYRISKRVRELCVFAVQDLVRDPPFSRLDLVTCRNVLIYLGTPLQKRLIATFHYALNPSGFLMLGSAETIGGEPALFRQIDQAHRIYAKLPGTSRPLLELSPREHLVALVPEPVPPPIHRPRGADVVREADELVLNQYAPAGVLVNPALDVVQFRGRTAPFLEMPSGEPSFNVLRMAREGLASSLRTALNQAKREGVAVRSESLRVGAGADAKDVAITVTPIGVGREADPHYLILFDSRPVQAVEARRGGASGKPEDLEAAQGVVETLQQDLASTRAELHRIIEEREAANEELQSANEEILSANEELQSTNEELETGKEELKATNEELTTVNEELHARNRDLAKANNDLNNLLNSVDLVYLMLDHELCIQRFSPGAEKVLHLIPGDLGRPVSDINLDLDVPNLSQLVREVINRFTPVESEVRAGDGRWRSMRIRPYKTDDNKIDGAIVALVDIDQAKRSQEALHQAELGWRALAEAPPDFLVAAAPLGRILLASSNGASLPQIGPSPEAVEDRFAAPDRDALKACLQKACDSGEAAEIELAPRLGEARGSLRARIAPIRAEGHVVALTVAVTRTTQAAIAPTGKDGAVSGENGRGSAGHGG